MLISEGKVDPRVKRTRQLLQNALMELVQEKAVDSITVQDIAARAEVNRATFYAHFVDKYDLLDYTAREIFQARLDQRLPKHPTLTSANLRLLILAICDHMGEFINHCKPVAQMNEHARMFLQVQPHLYEVLLTWMNDAAGARPACTNETTAMAASWAIWGAAFQWARTGQKVSEGQMVEQIVGLLENGLSEYLHEEAHA